MTTIVHQQVALLAREIPQGIEVRFHVIHGAEVDRALDAQDLELRALGQDFARRGELPLGVARIGH